MITNDKNIKINADVMEFAKFVQIQDPKPWFEIAAEAKSLNESAYLLLKRSIDIFISLLMMPAVVPVILLCALLIKLDSPGPIFYLQERTGRGGRRFKMYKLRTMVHDAETLKKKYSSLNTQTYPDFKIPDDPRITKIGKILRRTSMDEIPQIFNVLKGDMSLVGPRPTSFPAATYNLWHTERLEIRPGITGLWQVSGRADVDFDERNRLDIAYLRNRSLWLDLKIMFRTVGCVFNGRGAK
jgi:lipopolysaccharide/colanic/teichoic acid biosynthesis glycosyltransferase